jgi:hypothetical protein
MLGVYASSCGSWSLYCATGNIPMALSEAIIATYMTIHMARSPGSHSGRIASPCQEFWEGAEILRVWLSGNESAIIPEAVLDEFLQSLHAEVTRELEEFRARLGAHEALLRAQLEVARERKLREAENQIECRLAEAEEKIEIMQREMGAKIEVKLREAEDQIACKRSEAEGEIARLRQLERLRQTAAIERGEWPQ